MSPSDLNAVARLVLIAKRCGPQFLDDANSFDGVIGPGGFSRTDSQILDMARRVVQAPALASAGLSLPRYPQHLPPNQKGVFGV
jgi:hypothetical protein